MMAGNAWSAGESMSDIDSEAIGDMTCTSIVMDMRWPLVAI